MRVLLSTEYTSSNVCLHALQRINLLAYEYSKLVLAIGNWAETFIMQVVLVI